MYPLAYSSRTRVGTPSSLSVSHAYINQTQISSVAPPSYLESLLVVGQVHGPLYLFSSFRLATTCLSGGVEHHKMQTISEIYLCFENLRVLRPTGHQVSTLSFDHEADAPHLLGHYRYRISLKKKMPVVNRLSPKLNRAEVSRRSAFQTRDVPYLCPIMLTLQ
jgi:hypothetical protein